MKERLTNLEAICQFWAMNRQVGNSYLTIEGLRHFDRQAIYVSADREAMRQVKAENPHIIVQHWIFVTKEFLAGYHCPLVVDHYAMVQLTAEHTREKQHQARLNALENLVGHDTKLRYVHDKMVIIDLIKKLKKRRKY